MANFRTGVVYQSSDSVYDLGDRRCRKVWGGLGIGTTVGKAGD